MAATDHRNPIGLHARRCAALALAAGAVIALSACEKRDEATEKLSKAKSQLLSVSGGGAAAATGDIAARRYNDVTGSLGTVNGGATGAAAKLFSAQALMGESDELGSAQQEAEGQVMHLVSRARVQLELYLKQQSLAASMQGHDQSGDLKLIAEQAAKLGESLKQQTALLAENNSAVESLSAKVKELGARAKQARDNEMAVRAALVNLSAEQRAAAIDGAAKVRREADRIEVDQAGVELEAASMAKRSEEIQRDINRINRQLELNAEARGRVEGSMKLLVEQSAAASAAAQEAAKELSKAFEEVTTSIEQQLKPAYSAATGKYTSVATTAQQGAPADSGLANLLGAIAKQSLAGLHLGYGAILDQAGSLAARISAASGMPEAAKFQKVAEALNAEVKPAQEAAVQAATDAASKFQSAGVKGDAGEMLKRLSARLNGEPEEKPAEPAPDAAAPAAEPTKPDGAAAEPKPETAPADAPKEGQDPKPADPATGDPKPAEAPGTEAPKPAAPPGEPAPGGTPPTDPPAAEPPATDPPPSDPAPSAPPGGKPNPG